MRLPGWTDTVVGQCVQVASTFSAPTTHSLGPRQALRCNIMIGSTPPNVSLYNWFHRAIADTT